MRKTQLRAVGTSVAAVLLVAAAVFVVRAQSVQAAAPSVASITYLKGSAERAPKGTRKWQSVYKGTKLYRGDAIKTGKNTRLEAKLKDRSMLRLGSSSELQLSDAIVKKKRRRITAKLVIGKVWAAVTSFFGSSTFEIETSNAVAGVRGTRFSATQTAAGETLVKVYGGKVLVSNKPSYAIKGHTKSKRVEVAGPQEVSKKQWEELIAGAMQQIRIAKNGDMSQPESFELAKQDDDWEAWNSERDKLAGLDGDE